MTSEPSASGKTHRLARAGWVVLGCVAVGVGGVGIVLPILPTTVFFVFAAAAFAKSSPRLEAWVLHLPTIGPAVRDYRSGLGMPKRAKVTAAVMIVTFVSLSIWMLDHGVLRVVVAIAGVVGVLVVLFRVPTKSPADRHT